LSETSEQPRLWAVSDIHVSHNKNKPLIDRIQPATPHDWLIVAGDVAEKSDDIRSTLAALSRRFEKVIWVPGNHELWTTVRDPVQMFGAARYDYLVAMCRELGVVTPEDEFPVWPHDESGPITLVPMFLLYDYSFLPDGATNKAEGLKIAYDANVVCSDEFLLKPDPYLTRDAWCHTRVKYTRNRLEQLAPGTPVVLINHRQGHRELAHRVQHGVRGLRTPPHPADDVLRRGPLRGSVVGLPHGVGVPRVAGQSQAADPAGAGLPAGQSQRVRRAL
jgi:3',5'-cyclic AMP phosphodiesterase CpdA